MLQSVPVCPSNGPELHFPLSPVDKGGQVTDVAKPPWSVSIPSGASKNTPPNKKLCAVRN